MSHGSYTALDIGSALQADMLCQQNAAPLGTSTTFLAWLSDGTTDPARRFRHGTVPYVLPNNMRVADDWTALVTLPLQNPISITETMMPVENSQYVWTATQASGVASPNIDFCLDWSSAAAAPGAGTATIGDVGSTGAAWTHSNTQSLDVCHDSSTNAPRQAHLYCFEQPPPP